jgi:hypothetical protein
MATRTLKNHFIAGLASCNKEFPLHMWGRLFPQVILPLNLVRGSRIHSQLSAHAQVHGQFNFNSHPIGPPGTKVLVHEKSANRDSWAPHATEGWYMGPAMEHYRWYTIYNPDTRGMQTANTMTWFPTKVPFPFPNDSERLTAALNDVTNILQAPQPSGSATLVNNTQSTELNRLLTLFTPIQNVEAPAYIETKPDQTARNINPQPLTQEKLPNDTDAGANDIEKNTSHAACTLHNQPEQPENGVTMR